MTAKELRQNIRRGSFVVPFIGVQLVAVVAMAAEFQVGHASGASDFNGMLNPYLLVSSGPFWAAISVICLLIMPLGGFTASQGELSLAGVIVAGTVGSVIGQLPLYYLGQLMICLGVIDRLRRAGA